MENNKENARKEAKIIPWGEALQIWALKRSRVRRVRPVGYPSCVGASRNEPLDPESVVEALVDRWFSGRAAGDPLLVRWVYGEGGSVSDYRWQPRGETRMRALIRHGWAWAVGCKCPPEEALKRIESEFAAWWAENGVRVLPELPLVEKPLYLSREPISTREAAEELGVSVQRIHAKIRAGQLDAYRYGGRWRIRVPPEGFRKAS